MTDERPELRPAYRTLNEPTRLLGLSGGGWITVLIAGGAGYGWLLVSPLPWRANVSLAAIVLGLPTALVVLREQTTISPARLLAGVVAWRARPALLVAPTDERPVRGGALRLAKTDDALPSSEHADVDELPWLGHDDVGHPGQNAGRA
jgi:hypothetical protein